MTSANFTGFKVSLEIVKCYLRHILSEILDFAIFVRFKNRVFEAVLARLGRSCADYRTPRDVLYPKSVVNVQFGPILINVSALFRFLNHTLSNNVP